MTPAPTLKEVYKTTLFRCYQNASPPQPALLKPLLASLMPLSVLGRGAHYAL